MRLLEPEVGAGIEGAGEEVGGFVDVTAGWGVAVTAGKVADWGVEAKTELLTRVFRVSVEEDARLR